MCVPHASISLIILNKNVEKLPGDFSSFSSPFVSLRIKFFFPALKGLVLQFRFPSSRVCVQKYCISSPFSTPRATEKKAVRSERKIINTLNCLILCASRRLRSKPRSFFLDAGKSSTRKQFFCGDLQWFKVN